MRRSSLGLATGAAGALAIWLTAPAAAQVERLSSARTKSATAEAELRAADLKLARAVAVFRSSARTRDVLIAGAQRNLRRFLALEDSSVRSIGVSLAGSNLADVQRAAASDASREQIRIAGRVVGTLRLLNAPQYAPQYGTPSRARVLLAQRRTRVDRRAWYRSRGLLARSVRPVVIGAFGLTVPSTPFAFLPGALKASGIGRLYDEGGVQRLDLAAGGLPANQRYTVFLTEHAAPPFGRTVFVADFSTRGSDAGGVRLGTQVTRSFIFDGARTELDNVVVWFADQAGDNGLFTGANATDPDADGDPGATTPFDTDGKAGVAALSGRIVP